VAADSSNASAYRERLNAFTNRLDARLIAWQKQLEPFRGKRIAAFHNSWPYFAARFGLKIDLFLEPKPGIPPSPAHLAEVIAAMKADGINVVVAEPHQNRKTGEMVAARTGARLVDFTHSNRSAPVHKDCVCGGGTSYSTCCSAS
jgi:ABC-type Zn uptake system ZnuABC Zn-binding protein ZnuA